jgi:voltage-gated potassium channel
MEKLIRGMKNHYIVAGDTAAVGYVAGELIKTGRQVVVVSPDGGGDGTGAGTVDQVPTVRGDATDDPILQSAGIERATGLVACMDSDKDNILVVLTARRLAPRARIIASTERPETEVKLRTAGVDAVVSPSRIGGLRMASELVRPTVVSFLDRMLRDQTSGLRVEEVTAKSGSKAVGRTLASLGVHDVDGALLLAVRNTATEEYDFKPSPDTELESGMTMIVMADIEGRKRLEDIVR